MPDFTLRHPDSGDEHVVGDAGDRARLLSQGYQDVTDEAGKDSEQTVDAAADKPAPTPAAPTPAAAESAGAPKPRPAGGVKPDTTT